MKHTHMKQILPFFFITSCFFISNTTFGQNNDYPKREVRGVWIASVLNIDYPRVQSQDDNYLRNEWIKLLQDLQATGINTLMVQIRPAADALYPSAIVPYSKYLTGQQGQPPYNGFDPLAFMIQTAHAYGMEFHAWLNPYRASMRKESIEGFSGLHMIKQHPEWFVKYNSQWIFNPGIPEVRDHVDNVVAELVSNYDIDAIHFDDYFYPYREGKEVFQDGSAFSRFNEGYTSVDDWRRYNVSELIYKLSKTIKRIKPNVQFGISPFGVWRNSYRDPLGSVTQAGQTCYDDLYADILLWLKNDWIDYIAPQNYWATGFAIADHQIIADWWANNSYGKPVYMGLGAYRIGVSSSREPNWMNEGETPRQIRYDRNTPNCKGFVFFSAKDLLRNPLGIMDSLKNNYFKYPCFTPQPLNFPEEMVAGEPDITSVIGEGGLVRIDWKEHWGEERPYQYVVYRFSTDKYDFEDARNMAAIIPHSFNKKLTFFDKNVEPGKTYTYAITAATKHFKEGPPSEFRVITKDNEGKVTRLTWKEKKKIRECTVIDWFSNPPY
jgi:uncharacterized lipoprotein YddW (UPF0748 family)